jgi:hypothetical protein
MSYQETYYNSEEDKQNNKNPVILTLEQRGLQTVVTHVNQGGHNMKFPSPMPRGMYMQGLDLIKKGGNTMAKGGKRSKKQRKSVRKLRRKTASRKTASRKNDNRKK